MKQGERDPAETVRAFVEARYERGEWQVWRDNTRELTLALRALDREQASQLAREFWARYEHEDIADVLGQINAAVPGALTEHHEEFIEERMFLPSWLYLGATPETAERLLRLVDAPDGTEERSAVLLALAWIGDDLVRAAFRSWREQPPAWRRELYVGPDRYAEDAGWEVTPEGGRRVLYRETCYELVAVDEAEGTTSAHAVAVGTPNEAVCG